MTIKVREQPPAELREEIDAAAKVLDRGGIVVYPTETFYGLAADAANDQALEQVMAVKNRPPGKPMGLILSRAEELADLAESLPAVVASLVKRYWPGPLTLVVSARPGLNPNLLGPGGGVGARLSPHPVAAALAARLGRAITATSANISGRSPARDVSQLPRAITAGVDYVLDAGPCPGGNPSTVLDVRLNPPKVIRQGVLVIPGALGE